MSTVDHVALLLGPITVGCLLSSLHFGITFIQSFLFFTTFTRERWGTKALVAAVVLIYAAKFTLDIAFVYHTFILHFGDPDVVSRAYWVFGVEPILTATVTLIVQLFYARRVQLLTGRMSAVCVIVFCSVAQFAGGVTAGVETLVVRDFERFHEFRPAVLVWLATAAACDIVITYMLTSNLRTMKTGFVYTDSIVDRIIVVTIHTGMVTAVFAIANLVLQIASPHTGWSYLPNTLLCGLYSNALLSTLNCRSFVRRGLDGLSSAGSGSGSGSGGSRERDRPPGLTLAHGVGAGHGLGLGAFGMGSTLTFGLGLGLGGGGGGGEGDGRRRSETKFPLTRTSSKDVSAVFGTPRSQSQSTSMSMSTSMSTSAGSLGSPSKPDDLHVKVEKTVTVVSQGSVALARADAGAYANGDADADADTTLVGSPEAQAQTRRAGFGGAYGFAV